MTNQRVPPGFQAGLMSKWTSILSMVEAGPVSFVRPRNLSERADRITKKLLEQLIYENSYIGTALVTALFWKSLNANGPICGILYNILSGHNRALRGFLLSARLRRSSKTITHMSSSAGFDYDDMLRIIEAGFELDPSVNWHQSVRDAVCYSLAFNTQCDSSKKRTKHYERLRKTKTTASAIARAFYCLRKGDEAGLDEAISDGGDIYKSNLAWFHPVAVLTVRCLCDPRRAVRCMLKMGGDGIPGTALVTETMRTALNNHSSETIKALARETPRDVMATALVPLNDNYETGAQMLHGAVLPDPWSGNMIDSATDVRRTRRMCRLSMKIGVKFATPNDRVMDGIKTLRIFNGSQMKRVLANNAALKSL